MTRAGAGAPPRQLDALTGLRFLAALHVVLFHLTNGYLSRVPEPIKNLIGEGPESVTIFFILSGFVLAYTYQERAATNPRSFWWARVARVYPVYLLALIVALPMFVGHPPQYDSIQLDTTPVPVGGAFNTHLVAGIACVLLLQAWVPPAVLKWNYPGWSLSAEAFFYALFPRISAKVARLSVRRLRHVAFGAWLASIAMTASWLVASWYVPQTGVEHYWWGDVLQFNPLIRLPEFVIGVTIGFTFIGKWRPQLPGRTATIAAIMVVGIWTMHWSGASSHFENSLLIPVYAALVLALAYGEGWLAKWLSTRPMVALGHASYALYLIHAPMIFFAMRVFAVHPMPGGRILGTALELVLIASTSVGVSLAIHRFVEEPARAWIKVHAARRQPA